jgi:hypothetical protein
VASSCDEALDHGLDPVSALLQIGVNRGQIARRLKDIEMSSERKFVPNLRLFVVYPGIRCMRQHLALEVALYVL